MHFALHCTTGLQEHLSALMEMPEVVKSDLFQKFTGSSVTATAAASNNVSVEAVVEKDR